MKLNTLARNWLKKNEACPEGYKWASTTCLSLQEVITTGRPDWALWVLLRPGVLMDRELWLFACWSAEQALPIWTARYPDDARPRLAIETRRRWLDGQASEEELSAAESAARSAAESAAESAAWSAAESAAWAWILANTKPIFVDNASTEIK